MTRDILPVRSIQDDRSAARLLAFASLLALPMLITLTQGIVLPIGPALVVASIGGAGVLCFICFLTIMPLAVFGRARVVEAFARRSTWRAIYGLLCFTTCAIVYLRWWPSQPLLFDYLAIGAVPIFFDCALGGGKGPVTRFILRTFDRIFGELPPKP